MSDPKQSGPTRSLPDSPELPFLRKQAKLLLKRFRANDENAVGEISAHYRDADPATFRLSDAQLVLARVYGFTSWPRLASHVQSNQPTPEPLHYKDVYHAAKSGDVDKILELIDADETALDIADHNQRTPLTVAFAYQHFDLARLLIERGANVFAMNHSDRWAMRAIVEHGGLATDVREKFVEASITARVWDAEIFHAVWRRDLEGAKTILKNDPAQVSIRLAVSDGPRGFYNGLPYCGLSPIHYAVIAGDEPMVRLLLERGAEVDAVPHAEPGDSRHTPMYYVPEGCGDIAEILVDFGADVNHSTLYLSEGSKAMQHVVVAHGAGGTPLLAALAIGDFEKAAELIRSDPSVISDRLPNARIDTPLHMAVKAGANEIVELLLDHGMDIDTPTSRGFTALAMAPEMYCSLEMIQLLVERGADVHTGSDSPLYAAIWQQAYGHWDYESVIRYLAEQGSRPRGLCECVQGGNLAAAKLLVELGADVNERSGSKFYSYGVPNTGYTPLDFCTGVAGEHKHPDIAEFLRDNGGKHSADLRQLG